MYARVPSEGWHFLIVVVLDDTAPPQWIPPNKIWYNYKTYGIDGLVATIDNRVTELGGRPNEDSVLQKAARMGRERSHAERRKRFAESPDGLRRVDEELIRLRKILQDRIKDLNGVLPDLDLTFLENDGPKPSIAASSHKASFIAYWMPEPYAHSLSHAVFLVREFAGPFAYGGVWHGRPPQLAEFQVTPTVDYADEVVWPVPNDGELNSEALIDWLLKRLLDHVQHPKKASPPRRPPGSGFVNRWRDY